jgi:O-antigen ligase
MKPMQQPWVSRANRYLIYIILAVLPLERLPSLAITHPLHATIRLSQVAGAILILVNLPRLWGARRQWLRSPWGFLAIFVAATLLSAALSDHHVRALSVWLFTFFDIVLAWTFSLVMDKAKLLTYAKIVITSALVVCAFGLYQFFGDLLGLSTHLTGLRDAYTAHVFGFPRIQSTALEPLYFDNYLLIPIGLLLAALLTKWSWKFWLPLVSMITIVFSNVSRGAEIAVACMIVAAMVVAIVRRRFFTGGGGIIVITVASWLLAITLVAIGSHLSEHHSAKAQQAVTNFSHQAINLSSGESVVGRTVTRKLAVKAAESSPLLGIGPGNFGYYANQQMPDKFPTTDVIVNNEPLEILGETGIIGFLAIAGFAIYVVLVAWRQIKHLQGWERIWAVGLSLALLGIIIQYQTFSTLYITYIWVVVGLFWGLLNHREALA